MANPTFVQIDQEDGGTGSSSNALELTISAGDTVIIFTHITGATVTGVTDDGGNTYSLLANTGNAYAYGTVATAAATSVTVNFSDTTNVWNMSGLRFTGGTGFGNTNTTSSTDTNPTIIVTQQDANGLIVGHIGTTNASPGSSSIDQGTLRGTLNFFSNQGSFLNTAVTNTSATPGSVEVSVNYTNSSAYAGTAVEIRNVVAATGPRFYVLGGCG